jgi:hypothetical protein
LRRATRLHPGPSEDYRGNYDGHYVAVSLLADVIFAESPCRPSVFALHCTFMDNRDYPCSVMPDALCCWVFHLPLTLDYV